jgi:hypothetical protein
VKKLCFCRSEERLQGKYYYIAALKYEGSLCTYRFHSSLWEFSEQRFVPCQFYESKLMYISVDNGYTESFVTKQNISYKLKLIFKTD